MLVFTDGECYVGQAVDVAVRFTAHAAVYRDIAEVLFFRVRQHDLDRVERDAIHAVQRSGVRVRNVVHAAGRLGASAFDVLVPAQEQQRWLAALPVDVIGDELRPDQAEVRRKGQRKYRQLAADACYVWLLPVLHRYVARTVPLPRRTELSYWAVSACPDTGDGSRLVTLSVHHLETFIAAGTTIAVNVDGAVLRACWGTLDALMDAIPGVYAVIAGYAVRPDVVRLEVDSPDLALRLLDAGAVLNAARRLNLDLMRKGPTMHWKTHNFALADDVFAYRGDLVAVATDTGGEGPTLLRRGFDAVGAEQFDMADGLFRRALAAGEASAMIDLAAGHADRGEDEAAIELYKRAIAAAVPGALYAYGFYWCTRGDLDRAETYLRRAVEPGVDLFALYELGQLLDERGDEAGATAMYRQAAAVGHGPSLCGLGERRREADDPAGAERLFKQAIRRSYRRGLVHLGDLYLDLGRSGDASACYERAAKAGIGEGFSGLATIHENAGDLDKARRLYRRAADAGDESALDNLQRLDRPG